MEILLKPRKTKFGYFQVSLSKNKKQKWFQVHRLVAEAFILNPNNFPQINHKNEDKTNNSIENLEWCSAKYNCNYGTHNTKLSESMKNSQKAKDQRNKLFKAMSKEVYQLSIDGQIVKKWKSLSETGKNGYNFKNISACCLGKRKTANGFKWMYKSDYEEMLAEQAN